MLTPPNTLPDHQLKGNLLVADPALRDGTFDKSVIYLVDHDSEGSLGLILNHPTGKKVGDLIASQEFQPLQHIPVYHGGPVAKEHLVFSSFSWTKTGKINCQTNISAEEAIAHTRQSGRLVRAFVGYSTWQAGQLTDEIQSQAWFSTYCKVATLSQNQDLSLWKFTLDSMSPYHQIIALTPDNPFSN